VKRKRIEGKEERIGIPRLETKTPVEVSYDVLLLPA